MAAQQRSVTLYLSEHQQEGIEMYLGSIEDELFGANAIVTDEILVRAAVALYDDPQERKQFRDNYLGATAIDKLDIICPAARDKNSVSAISAFDSPCAISSSTSRSRGVREPIPVGSSASVIRRETSGSTITPPAVTRFNCASKSRTWPTRSLSKYPVPACTGFFSDWLSSFVA